jgi:MOSC domain-containing protein YiiM
MRLAEIWYAEEGSAPMQRTETVRAVEGGLAGDRYQTGRGHYSPFDVCEVTFVEREAIEEIRERYDVDLTDGRHRRNLVTEGVDVHEDLLDARFRVGEAVFEGTRPRPPCAHVERVAGEEGVMRALKRGRGGVCAKVVEEGELRVGDEVEVLESTAFDGEGLADAIRDRVGR